MKLDKTAFGWGSTLMLFSAFAIFASLMQPAFATDWYADAVNGNDAYDGTSAATAKKTIQAAVDLVSNGDTVYVAPGHYNSGSMTCTFNSTVARVVITNKINLVATGRKDETFIDGGEEMRCIYVYQKSSGSPRYNAADGTVIRGFTVCNGRVSGTGYGGGAYISGSYLIDCVVSNNAAYRGGGSVGGAALRCLFIDNFTIDPDGTSKHYGEAAQQTVFLNSVIAFQRGGNRIFSYAGTVVNCTIVGNNNNSYTFIQNSNYRIYNTIFAGNKSQTLYRTAGSAEPIVSNCVFSAGTTGLTEELCGNNLTQYPNYCFAAPVFNDWRPTTEFGISAQGDSELLKRVSLPAALENERYIDYNGKPIPQTGAITCGAVQEIYTPSDTLLRLPAGFEVEGYGTTPTLDITTFASNRYAWVESPGLFKMRKVGAELKDLVWYAMSTNGATFTSFFPNTNNWVAVATVSSRTNLVGVVAPNATYYVDAMEGNDDYEGEGLGTAEHPYATIQAAVDVAPTGKSSSSYKNYVIIVRKGEYKTGGMSGARVYVPNKVGSTWQYRNFRIVSEEGPGKTFIIGAAGEGADGCGTGAMKCCYSAIGTFIQGFTLTGGHSANTSAFLSNSTGNGILADCIVTNNCGGEETFENIRLQRCRIAGNKLTAANACDLRNSIATMCEIVQSPDSVSGSYAVVGATGYTYFSAVKGRCNTGSHYYASILEGGQSIGQSQGYARYCFAHGDALIDASGTAIQNCQNGKSRCLNFSGGDFRLRSDSPAIGMVTYDPSLYRSALTFDLDGNLPPLDTLEGWTAGPRQRASVEWHARGATFVIR